MTNTISPTELAHRQAAGDSMAIIDVRTALEFREVHVPHAINLPLEKVSSAAVQQLADSVPIYVICRSGQRAAKACERLADDPLIHVNLVEGGTEGWIQAGLNVVRGKKTMSLERQVRLTAGALVFLGTVLGYLLHPAFLLLSGGMGLGLFVAALTDSCAMGMMLSRMPWNRN